MDAVGDGEDAQATSPASMSKMQKNRPAPLTFRQEPEPSPLLHATFGSPQTLVSSTQQTLVNRSLSLLGRLRPGVSHLELRLRRVDIQPCSRLRRLGPRLDTSALMTRV